MRGSTLMGRGRQKAKQTKVARELKYYTPDTDFASLERELSGKSRRDDDRYEDKYADRYADDEDDYDDESSWKTGS